MSLRDEVAAGAHDGLLIGGGRAEIGAILDRDRVLDGLDASEARYMKTGDLREAILSGPAAGTGVIGTPGSSRVAAIAAEDTQWDGAGDSSEIGTYYAQDIDRQRRYYYWLMAHHPIAINIVGHWTNLTIGEGFKIPFYGPRADARARKWRKIAQRVKWGRRLRKLIRHTYGLGEWFTLLMPLAGTVERSAAGTLKSGTRSVNRTDLRGLDGGSIKEVITQGDARYDPGNAKARDVETIIAYRRSGAEDLFLHPDDVIHHRAIEIGNLTRSPSILHGVLRYLRYVERFIQDRYFLNHMRARIPLVRKVHGGQANVDAQARRDTRLPPPGTMITENGATEYQFPELNIDAREVQDDLYAQLTMIAAGVQLPVYLITSDPANTNYASLMASDSPTVAHFEGLQSDVWVDDIARMVRALMNETMELGEDFDVIPGSPIKRNLKTIADSLTRPVEMRIMSRRTAAERMDLDYTVEQQRIEEEDAAREGMPQMADDDEDFGVDRGGRPQADDNDGLGRQPRPSE